MRGGRANLEDLEVYQAARELKRRVYGVVQVLPGGLRNPWGRHLCEAAASISANIAEGYGRFSFADRRQFFRFARGSAYEVIDHIDSLEAFELADATVTQRLIEDVRGIIRMINGYLRYLKAKSASPTYQ